MLPIGSGSGQLWHDNRYLCDVLYEVDYPLAFATVFRVKHLKLSVQNYEAASLLKLANLTLVMEDGIRCPLPQALELAEEGYLECTVTSRE